LFRHECQYFYYTKGRKWYVPQTKYEESEGGESIT